MDDSKKRTLLLIESTVHRLGVMDRGRQLILVARDYAEDGDLVSTRRILRQIDELFYDSVPALSVTDEDVRYAIAVLISTLGLEW